MCMHNAHVNKLLVFFFSSYQSVFCQSNLRAPARDPRMVEGSFFPSPTYKEQKVCTEAPETG